MIFLIGYLDNFKTTKKFNMNIKDGDLITLENGNVVRVKFEKQSIKPITELIVGKKYLLKDTGGFCHCFDIKRYYMGEELAQFEFVFVGKVFIKEGERYIFHTSHNLNSIYAMYSTRSLDFVIGEIK